ncbi:MAG: COX15/CtaA family protein [Acidimicrobiales bacterium]|nr:COX15/CtaA family protein [Acidimicrobiales bacterium]
MVARLRSPRLSPAGYRRLTALTVVALALIILTGAAVRLTGSGLGCPDWPGCTGRSVVAPLSFHPMVEFLNRVVTVVVTVAMVAAVAGALLRRPFRSDLVRLSAWLIAGVLAQIVLGGLTVLYKLAPPFVMAHFMLSIALLGVALVLHRRTGEAPARARPLVGPHLVWLSRLMVAGATFVLTAGTAAAGAGPLSGSPHTERLPFRFQAVVEFHSTSAFLLIGLTLGLVVAAHQRGTPPGVQRRARLLLLVMVAQGVIGYTQYFLKVPAGLVELHIAGATFLWMVALWFHLGLFVRPALRVASERDRPALDEQPVLAGG